MILKSCVGALTIGVLLRKAAYEIWFCLCLIPLALVIQSLLFVKHSSAQPEGFLLTEISAKEGSNAYPFYAWPALNEHGEVCYRASAFDSSAILKSDGTEVKQIALADETNISFGLFITGVCSIDNDGDVAFDACKDCTFNPVIQDDFSTTLLATTLDDAAEKGVYIGDGIFPPTLLQGNGASLTDFNSALFPTINSDGAVSFVGELNDGTQGIWVNDTGVLSNPFNNSGPFAALGSPFLNRNGELAFSAEEKADGTVGIYGPDGVRIDAAENVFSEFSVPVINDQGNIAYLASSGEGLNIKSGAYVDGQARALNSSGAFSVVDLGGFQFVSINDLGDLVFSAFRPNGDPVVFLSLDGGLIKLFERGDTLPGYASPVETAIVGRQSINSQRQIALVVVLQDFTELVVRLDPDGFTIPQDQCPQDTIKFEVGICGCGFADLDSNSDGIYDCHVTSVLDENARELRKLVRKLKRFVRRNKSKAIKQTRKSINALLPTVVELADNSANVVQLNDPAADLSALTTAVNKSVKKTLKTRSSKFKKRVKRAIARLKNFLNALQVDEA